MTKSKIEIIDLTKTPITKKTFETQGWDLNESNDVEGRFYYFTLALPKDNPDEQCQHLISSCNDEYTDLGIKKGEYYISIFNFNELGMCQTEEEIEILYKALTGDDL
jgi:hypothetical protein